MTIVDEFRQNESRVLDRLVDGELSQADRRALLAALDDEPGAWRRCALAFLESQSWRWQLNQIASEPLLAKTALQARCDLGRSSRGSKRASFWGTCLAIAGSLLVAFDLGTRVSQESPQVAGSPTAEKQTVQNETPLVPATSEPANSLADNASNVAGTNSTSPAEDATSEQTPFETLTLAEVDDSGNANPDSQINVRVRDAEADATDLDALLANAGTTLPAALAEQLKQAGWEVTRRRELVPITLSDGRQVVLPMEQVDVQMSNVAHF